MSRKKRDSDKQKDKGAAELKPVYPVWAKLLVLLALTVWISSAAFFTCLMNDGVKILRQATDPVFISSAFNKICWIDKLPEGFKYQFAASAFNFDMVALTHESDGTLFMFGVLPLQQEKRIDNARELCDRMAEQGIPGVSRDLKIEERKSLTIGKQEFQYLIGSAQDRQSQGFGGFIAAALPDSKRAFLIYGVTPLKPGSNISGAAVFNMEAAKGLFGAIKQIKALEEKPAEKKTVGEKPAAEAGKNSQPEQKTTEKEQAEKESEN